MSNLNNKVISSNFQRLLQISESSAVSDGTGSAFALRLSGSSNVGINHDPVPGFSLFVDGAISASTLSVNPGTIFLGTITMSQNNDGGVTFQDSSSSELGAFAGPGYFVLSSSIEEHGSNRPLFSMTQEVNGTQNVNVMQVTPTFMKFYTSLTAGSQYSFGGYPSGSDNEGDFFINDNFTVLPQKNQTGVLGQPLLFISKSRNVGLGHFGTTSNRLTTSGSIYALGADGHITASGNLLVEGNAIINGNLTSVTPTFTGHITASGNISASGTIFANDFQSATGGTGIDFNDDIVISGDITASGGISASGEVKASALSTTNNLSVANKILHTGNTNTSVDFLTNVIKLNAGGTETLSLRSTGANIVGDITASGNISASNIFGATGSLGELDVDGDVYVKQYIKHKGDANTLINFTDNRIRFDAGGINFLSIEEDGSAPHPVTVNNGGNRINFRVVDRNTDLLLKTDSEEFKVNLYHAGSQKLETATDGINVTGQVSASGQIIGATGSFIGKVSGSNLHGTNSGDVTLDNSRDYITISGQTITTNVIDIEDDTNLLAGAGIFLNGRVLSVNTGSLISFYSSSMNSFTTTGAITAGGNVSGSGTGSFSELDIDGTITAEHIVSSDDMEVTDDLSVGGDLSVARYIKHTGDFDTFIDLTENNIGITTRNITSNFTYAGLLTSHITASGNISASGNLTATGATFKGHVTASSLRVATPVTASGLLVLGNSTDDNIQLSLNNKLYFESDRETFIQSNGADLIRVVAGGSQMLLLDQDTGNRAVFGNSTKVFIGANNNALPDKELVVDGQISASSVITGNTGSFNNVNTKTLIVTEEEINFNNLPTRASQVSAGQLFTLSGSQLPFSGSSTLLSSISASRFVIIKE